MARTKQTARRSTGGKMPRKVMGGGLFGGNPHTAQPGGGFSGFGGAAPSSTSAQIASVATDYESTFEDLGADVLGEQTEDAEGGSQKGHRHHHHHHHQQQQQQQQEQQAPFLAFDFRRGSADWPMGATLLGTIEAMESLSETVRSELAEELRQQEEDEQTSVGEGKDKSKGKGTGRSRRPGLDESAGVDMMTLSDSDDGVDSSEDESSDKFDARGFPIRKSTREAGSAPPGCVFEELADGSTALVLPAGSRLKLDLKALLNDDWKERATGKVPKKKKKTKAMQSGPGLPGRALGPLGVEGTPVGGGSYSERKKKKEFISAYTITMDIKLDKEPPAQGLSLFQARVAFVDHGPDGSGKAIVSSDGDCVINSAGGVGRLGAYGDVTKAKVEAQRWRRVVITVKCAGEKGAEPQDNGLMRQTESSGFSFGATAAQGPAKSAKDKSGMRTYVDAKACATVEGQGGEFASNGRYSIDADHGLLLFSSTDVASMPGVAVRYVRVDKICAGKKQVEQDRARDRVISMYNEMREAQIDEQRQGLVLAELFPKPRPIWLAPTLTALFGDPFIEGTTFEGQSAMPWSFAVLNLAMQKMLTDQIGLLGNLQGGSSVRSAVADMLYVMRRSAPCFTMMQRLLKTPNEGQLFCFLRKLKKTLAALGPGESILVPAFVAGQEILFLICRKTQGIFCFVVINTDPEGGLKHHEVTADSGSPKLKFRSAMVFDSVPQAQALDDVFWMAVYNLTLDSNAGDTARFYDILLPFLTGKSLEESLVEAHDAADTEKAGCYGDWRSPQRSSTSYVRCLLGAMNFMLRARNVDVLDCKLVGLALRAQFVEFIGRDLDHVRPDENGAKVIEMSCSQLSYAASKLAASWDRAKTVSTGAEIGAEPESSTAAVQSHESDEFDDALNSFIFLSPSGEEQYRDNSENSTATQHADRSTQWCQAVNSIRELVERVIRLVGPVLNEVSTPPNLSLAGPEAGEQQIGRTDAVPGSNDLAVVQSYDLLAPEVEQVPPDPGQAIPTLPYMAVDLTQVPRRVHTRDEAVDALRTCDRLCSLMENQQHCIKNRKFLIVSFIQHVLTTCVPVPKPRAVGEDARSRIHKERSRKRRAEQCRLVLISRQVLTYRDQEAAAAADKAADAAELAAQAARAADGTGTASGVDMVDGDQAEENDGSQISGDDQLLLRSLLDAAASASVEIILDEKKRDAVLAERYLPTKLSPRPEGTGVFPALVGCAVVTFDSPETARAALDQLKPRSQALGIVARPWKEAGSRFQLAPPTAEDDTNDLPEPDLARGLAEEEAMLQQAKCIWDQDITYGLQESLMSTLHRLMEHFVAAAISIPQNRAFDAVCCVIPGVIAAIADSVMRRAAIDHPSACCTHLFGATSKGKQLGLPGYGLSVGSFAQQTATCQVHAPELVIARTAVLDYFRSPSQRRLDKIYDWETQFLLRPTRSLVKYMRSILRESANTAAAVALDQSGTGMPGSVIMLLSRSPTASVIHKDYPEFFAYRDIAFWWKFFLNPDMSVFPNNPLQMASIGSGTTLPDIPRMNMQLSWQWDQQQRAYQVTATGMSASGALHCVPNPAMYIGKSMPVARWPSSATASFYIGKPAVRGEDDIIYRKLLPTFADDEAIEAAGKTVEAALLESAASKQHHATLVRRSKATGERADKTQRAMAKDSDKGGQQTMLSQRDSELLLSFLTVPYIRMPLVLQFFSSNDRIHKLCSHKLRGILDGVLFEPQACLEAHATDVEPVVVPTMHPKLLASPYGLLVNELVHSPSQAVRCITELLQAALDLDTGAVCDIDAFDFNVAVDIILYTARLGSRVDNYITFLLDYVDCQADCTNGPLRGVALDASGIIALRAGQTSLRKMLRVQYASVLEDYLKKLHLETTQFPEDEGLVDRNTRLACDLHAHKLLIHRNHRRAVVSEQHGLSTEGVVDTETATSLTASFVFLTTRHTFGKVVRAMGQLLVPETDLYEVLSTTRRSLISWCGQQSQASIDCMMQTALQISTSSTGSLRASAQIVDVQNRWSRIAGARSCGRFVVSSVRSIGVSDTLDTSIAVDAGHGDVQDLRRQSSVGVSFSEVPESAEYGVEMDLQLGQMTLRSRHLSALPSDIAGHADVVELFGDATIQASTIETSQHRSKYNLVGLNHEIWHWSTPHTSYAPISDQWERQYDPAELYASEQWLVPIFEPIRRSMFDGPMPKPMTFMMPERPLAKHAEVAVLLGLHQELGGPYKLVYIFRAFKCLHIYECVSHGREYFWALHLTTDTRFTMRDMQPDASDRRAPYPAWWERGSGSPYPAGGPGASVCTNLLTGDVGSSLVIVRDASHPENLSGGSEVYIPSHLLLGLIPSVLLEEYRFWQDETSQRDLRAAGKRVFRGYPKKETTNTILIVCVGPVGDWDLALNGAASPVYETTGLPGRTVRILRKSKAGLTNTIHRMRRIANVVEHRSLLAEKKKKRRQKELNLEDAFDDDKEEPETYVVHELVLAWDKGGKLNPHTELLTEARWAPATIQRLMPEKKMYMVTFQDTNMTVATKAHHVKKLKPEMQANIQLAQGMGIWDYDDMSEEENEDWRSSSEDEVDSDEEETADGSKTKSKRQLKFTEFWDVPMVLAAAGGDETVCISALSSLAEDGHVYSDMCALSEAVKDCGIATDDGKDNAREDEETMVLLNLMYAPRRSRLHSVAKTLARLENLSYVLAWTSCSPDGPGTAKGPADLTSRERARAQAAQPVTRGCPALELIELPRLKLSFAARADDDGDMKLFSLDHANLFVSNSRDPRAVKLLAGVPHSLLMETSQGEMSILVSVWKVSRPRVGSMPFSTSLVMDHANATWNAAQDQHYFLYPIHVSMGFLMTRGMTSAMYLLLLRFLHRDYAAVFRLAESVASDASFDVAARYIWSDLAIANDDPHPDAMSCRVKLALVTIDSGEGTPWDLTSNQSRLAVKLGHVSVECRVSQEEELQLLSSDRMVLSPDHRFYQKGLHTLYRMTLVKNRLAALATIASHVQACAGSGSGFEDVITAKARCWVPPRAATDSFIHYQDNTVFGATYNEVINVESPEHLATLLAESEDTSGELGGPVLTVLCFYVDWSPASLKQEMAVRDAAPSIPFVRFLAVKADHAFKSVVRDDYCVTDFPTWILLRGDKEVRSVDRTSSNMTDSTAEAANDEVMKEKAGSRVICDANEETQGTNGLEQLKALIDFHVTQADHAAHETREKIAEEKRRAARGGADEEEALEELPWIWDPDMAGSSVLLGDKGMVAVLPRLEIGESKEARWEFCTDQRAMQSTSGSVDVAAMTAKMVQWTAYGSALNAQLEQMWMEGRVYQNSMRWEHDGKHKQSHANTNTGSPLLCFEHNMVLGLVEYDMNSGEMLAIRRRGLIEQVPSMPDFTPKQKAVIARAEMKAKLRDEQVRELRKMRKGKDIEVVRGTVILEPGTGITTWKLNWGHHPGRNGENDAVGLCTADFNSFGPGPGPLLGAPPPPPEHEEGSLEYSYYRYKPPTSTQTSTCSIGIYASGLVVHGGDAVATVAHETSTLWTKGSVITMSFDSDTDRGTLTVAVDDRPLEQARLTNLFDKLGAEALYPSISLCPCVDDDDTAGDDDKENDQEKQRAEQEELRTGAPNAAAVTESAIDTPTVTILTEIETTATATAPPPAPSDLGVSLAATEESGSSTPTAKPEVASGTDSAKAVWMYEVPEGPWSCYSDTVNDILERAFDDGEPHAVVPCKGQLYKVYLRDDKPPTDPSAHCGYCGNRGHDMQQCPQNPNKTNQIQGLRQEPHGGEPGEGGQRVRRMVIDNWPEDAWRVISLQHNPPTDLNGQSSLSVLQKIWKDGETMDGQKHGLGFLFLYGLLQGSSRCAVMSRGYSGYVGYGGGYSGYTGYGGASGSAWGRPQKNDGHRFASLLAQLFTDRTSKSILGSMINVMVRNRRIGRRLPRFYDTRIGPTSTILNAFAIEDSGHAAKKKVKKTKKGAMRGRNFGGMPHSAPAGMRNSPERVPLADLLGEIVPLFKRLKRSRGALRFPPPPPYPQLPKPPTHTVVHSIDCAAREGVMARLSDYSCGQREVCELTQPDIIALCENVQYGPREASAAAAAASGDTTGQVVTVKSSEDLLAAIQGRPGGGIFETPLVVVDFYSNHCGPCVAMAPVFTALAAKTPCALFCKIDCDESDDLARDHSITSLPTFKLFRRSSETVVIAAAESTCIATIVGGGAQSTQELIEAVTSHLTEAEKLALERHNDPSTAASQLARLSTILATGADEVRALATAPLSQIDLAALSQTHSRAEPLPTELPFDLSNHPASRSSVAKGMLSRMRKDVEWWAKRTNGATSLKLLGLGSADLEGLFSPLAGAVEEEPVRNALSRLQGLLTELKQCRQQDVDYIATCVPLVLHAANHVRLDSSDTMEARHAKVQFILRRYSRQESTVWLEFLYGALLSSQCSTDLTNLNPHLPCSVSICLLQAVTIAILRANRIGQTNRCISAVKQLTVLLTAQLGIQSPSVRAAGRTVVIPKIAQHSEAILGALTGRRHFMSTVGDQQDCLRFDPRFLVFEFTWNILLRAKQIEIVNDLIDNLKHSTSKVKQMIMGAGKTTVVAPLLALMLADGDSLVLSVVPRALVEMSRTRMRETFAVIVQKRVYTLTFDRSSIMRQNKYETLLNAKRNRGIVVSTPTTVKSIMLSSIELQSQIADKRGTIKDSSRSSAKEGTGSQERVLESGEDGTLTLAKIAAAAASAKSDANTSVLTSASADELQRRLSTTEKVLDLFKEGVMLLDEVDLILHPLKSELNFPTGQKFDLDGSEEGVRWDLPIHLMDAIFYAQLGCTSAFEDTSTSQAVLQNIRAVIEEGYDGKHLQRLPHITLLNREFYASKLRPAMAEWAGLWLMKHHLHGISRAEAVQYLLDGGTARSETGKKLRTIESAIQRRRITLGLDSAVVPLTLAHEQSLTREQSAERVLQDQELRRQRSREAASQSEFDVARQQEELESLNEAAVTTQKQIDAVESIYTYEQQVAGATQRRTDQLARLDLLMLKLAKAIKALEYPRDTSLDNMVVVVLSSHFAETEDGNSAAPSSISQAEYTAQSQQLQVQQQNVQQQMQQIQQAANQHGNVSANPQLTLLQNQQQELQQKQQELQMRWQVSQQQKQTERRRTMKVKKGSKSTKGAAAAEVVSASPTIDLCTALEGMGYTVKRSYQAEDAILKARSLQQAQQLRCVITDSASRGPCPANAAAAAAAEAETVCTYCGEHGHPAWKCPSSHFGRQPEMEAAEDHETFVGIDVVNELLSETSDFVLQNSECDPLPACRVGVMDDILKMGAAGRKMCWAKDIAVFSNNDETVEWVRDLGDWGDENDSDAAKAQAKEAAEDAEFFQGGDLEDAPVQAVSDGSELLRASSASTMRLHRLRTRYDALEAEKNRIAAVEETEAKEAQFELKDRTSRFQAVVVEREARLQKALEEITIALTEIDAPAEVEQGLLATSSSARDAALALAWVKCVQRFGGAQASELVEEDQSEDGWEEMTPAASVQKDMLQRGYHKAARWISAELRSLQQVTLAAKIVANVSFSMQRLLNFAHDWLSSLLPHCLAKVNRVTFGLLTPEESQAALEKDPNMPRSRLMLAVPFLGKDVPSQSSEFAHPDVIVGLTILAYRYSGLRPSDFSTVMDSLASDFTNDIGPPEERAAFLRHAQWALHSGGTVRGLTGRQDAVPTGSSLTGLLAHLPEPDLEGQADPQKRLEPSSGRWLSEADFVSIYGGQKEWDLATDEGIEVVQLKFLQQSNEEQMSNLYRLWAKAPRVIHRYLSRSVFPENMRSQRKKISASGQAIGGDMLFGRRVGFSGTPSDLLPVELGQCDYETGDDGKMLSTVLDPQIVDCAKLGAGWCVDDLLDTVAQMGGMDPDKRFHALIDPGALITGYSNLQVAEQLLQRGLEWCDGVVFLDDEDRQQVLVRATWRVVPADQCGVPLVCRFAFYDQIHTTGMDIQHVVNARAAITLGKDMVFRDYVQGAFRMRGIGRGQRITVFIIPEVEELMARELSVNKLTKPEQKAQTHSGTHDSTLCDIVGWLTINSMNSEKIQWQMLAIQNTGNIYRKNAFRQLRSPDSKQRCLEVFDEPIDFSLNAAVAEPVSLKVKLSRLLDANAEFLITPQDHATGHNILDEVGYYSLLEGGDSGQRLETEQEREQEQEQQKEVQQQKDQEIEIEKFVDRDYNRNEEAPKPWPFALLAKSPERFEHPGTVRTLRDAEAQAADDEQKRFGSEGGSSLDNGADDWQYRLRDFRLKQQASASFPPYLHVSNNYYNRKWRGLRRLKNVVVVLEWVPSAAALEVAASPPAICPATSESVLKALRMLCVSSSDETASAEDALSPSLTLGQDDLAAAIAELADRPASRSECDELFAKYGASKSTIGAEEMHRMVSSGQLHTIQSGRHFVAVSLAEAETIRRILHVRRDRPVLDIAGNDTEIALRYSPLSSGGDASIGNGGVLIDVSSGWARRTTDSDRPAETGAPSYQLAEAHNCFRFFDCDTHFSEPAIQVLVRALQWSEASARERFFTTTIGHRRRLECKWEETPLVRAVTLENEWEAVKQRAYAAFFRRMLDKRSISLWAAFRAFDQDGDSLISGGELSGAMRWLGVPNACRTAEDVVDFLEAVDINRDSFIDYKEFMDELSTKQRHRSHTECINEEGVPSAVGGAASVPSLPKFGTEDAEAVRDVIVRRMRQRQARAREEKLRQGAVQAELERQSFRDELERRDIQDVGGANPNTYKIGDVQCADFSFSCGSLPLRTKSHGQSTFKRVGDISNTGSNGIADESNEEDGSEDEDFGGQAGFGAQMAAFGGGFGGGGFSGGGGFGGGFGGGGFGGGGGGGLFGSACSSSSGFGSTLVTSMPHMPAPSFGGFGSSGGGGLFGSVSSSSSGFGSTLVQGHGETGDSEPQADAAATSRAKSSTVDQASTAIHDAGRDVDGAALRSGDVFLDVENGSQVFLQLPPPPFKDHDATASGEARLTEQYAITLVMRVANLPPGGQRAAVLRFSQPSDVASRYRLCSSLFLDDEGHLVARDTEGSSADDSTADAACMRPGEWHVITANVDCSIGRATVLVDGYLSCILQEPPQLLALGTQITLFGGGKAAEHRGGHIRFVSVRRGALLSEQQVTRLMVLKNPAITLSRILCVDEPMSSSSADEADKADESSPPRWPDRNRRQCVYLASIRAASACGCAAEDDTGDTLGSAPDESQGAALGSELVLRLGSVGAATGCTSAAFYAMPTAKLAHSARHNLTTVEAARVKKSKEELKIAQLEHARDAKAAKAAGVPLHVPNGEEAAGLAALRVVQKTQGIETAPRLARVDDLLTSWPLVHGLCPPAPADKAQTESRFILASGVPNSVTAAELHEACTTAFESAVVSCDSWPVASNGASSGSTSTMCIGLWSGARASRALKTPLVIHGLPITLTTCPCQDVPSNFELSGSVSLAAPGSESEGQDHEDEPSPWAACEYCEECGEEEFDPDENVCNACGAGRDDY